MGVIDKIWITLHHTLGDVGMHVSEISPRVEGMAKTVNLCALCKTIEPWWLGSAHWISGIPLRNGLTESITKIKNYYNNIICHVLSE